MVKWCFALDGFQHDGLYKGNISCVNQQGNNWDYSIQPNNVPSFNLQIIISSKSYET